MSAVAYLRLLSETVPVPLLHTASTAVDVAQQGTLPPRPPRTQGSAGFRISESARRRRATDDGSAPPRFPLHLRFGRQEARLRTRVRPRRKSSTFGRNFCSTPQLARASPYVAKMWREIGRDRSTAPEAKLLRGIASV